jgi:hypothetical protein
VSNPIYEERNNRGQGSFPNPSRVRGWRRASNSQRTFESADELVLSVVKSRSKYSVAACSVVTLEPPKLFTEILVGIIGLFVLLALQVDSYFVVIPIVAVELGRHHRGCNRRDRRTDGLRSWNSLTQGVCDKGCFVLQARIMVQLQRGI